VEDVDRLAYEEVVRALSQEAAALEGLRTRAGLLLSAASIATSFLGGQALHQAHLHVLTWVAVAAFVGLSISVTYVLWPHRDRRSAAMPSRLIARIADTDSPRRTRETLRALALFLEATYSDNEELVDRLSYGLRTAMVLLALEVAAWTAALAAS
jgi:hypothetical protein